MSVSLLDWRRRVGALYSQVRSSSDFRQAHEQWRATRDELMSTHPDSPLPPEEPASFTGLPVAPYDPRIRFELEIDTDVAPERLEVPTATDGVVPFERVGTLHLPGLGGLDVWWLAY